MSRWVCFDIGEVLVDETRVWTTWAHVLGISPLTLMAALGAAIAGGGGHREAFVRVGHRGWAEREAEVEAALGPLDGRDLYPDARSTLDALADAGWRVAVCGNQPARRRDELAAAGVRAEVLTTSEHLGAEKPDPVFYRRLLAELGSPRPHEVAYVGDRVDNDVMAATEAGLRAIWLRRGPWGVLGADMRQAAALSLGSLADLPDRLAEAFAP